MPSATHIAAPRQRSSCRPFFPVLLIAVVSVFAIGMVAPGRAAAATPVKFQVFLTDLLMGTAYPSTAFAPVVDQPYAVKFKGRSTATWSVTGIPVRDIIATQATPEQVLQRKFFGIWNETSPPDLRIPFDSAYMNSDPPAIIVTSARGSGGGPIASARVPFLLLPQLAATHNNGNQILKGLSTKLVNIDLGQGALLHPRIVARHSRKSGTWTFTATGVGGPYKWVLSRSGLDDVDLGDTRIVSTKALSDITVRFTVTLSISRENGSYGIDQYSAVTSNSGDGRAAK